MASRLVDFRAKVLSWTVQKVSYLVKEALCSCNQTGDQSMHCKNYVIQIDRIGAVGVSLLVFCLNIGFGKQLTLLT